MWNQYFALREVTRAKILAFLSENECVILRHLGRGGDSAYARINTFVKTGWKSEEGIANFQESAVTRYIHGDLNSRNILVDVDGSGLTVIDYANSGQGHAMRDFAKLEADLVLIALDSDQGLEDELGQLPHWKPLLQLFDRGTVFAREHPPKTPGGSVLKMYEVIIGLRAGLRQLSGEPREKQYLLALLHYFLAHLSYPDVALPKRVFAVSCIGRILRAASS